MSDSSSPSDSDYDEPVNRTSDSDEAPRGKAKTKKTKAGKALHSGSESDPPSESDHEEDDEEKSSAARKRTKPTPVRSTKRTKRTRSDSNSDDEMFRKLEADGIEMNAEERANYLEMSEKMREEFIYQKTIDMEDKKHREEIQTKIRLRKPGKPVKAPPKPTSDSDDDDRSPSPKGASPAKGSDSEYDAEFQRPSEIDKKRKQKSALSDLLSKRREKEKKEAKKVAQLSASARDGDESDSSASSSSSSSSSRSSSPSSVSSHARSATPEQEVPKKQVENKQELEQARISRFRLAKFVHAPFFKKALVGCYVRVGELPPSASGNALRIGLVLDVVETAKTYNVEGQRTNKGLKLRFGARDERTIRLEFISNQQFTEKDFTEWLSVMKNTGATLPNIDQLEKKAKEIKEASNHSYTDAEVDAMLVERKRFEQKTGNFAAKKSQLLTEKDCHKWVKSF
ncbi:unnamed protein product, partial [Mesorhabditis belari]|uniref:Plus3 domain-containing protein n=1 Tax=Mesorhabditis belari TaxID=2138241 RepID=A0AAF3EM70_9BILA